jgi:hypothetical protein
MRLRYAASNGPGNGISRSRAQGVNVCLGFTYR